MFHTVRQIKQSHYPYPNTCSRPAEDLLINVTLRARVSCVGESTAVDQIFKKILKNEAAGGGKNLWSHRCAGGHGSVYPHHTAMCGNMTSTAMCYVTLWRTV